MTPSRNQIAERILVLTPTGRDAEMVCRQITADGLPSAACRDLTDLLQLIDEGAGAVVVAQEALSAAGAEALLSVLEKQPPWSDLPVLFLSEPGPVNRPRLVAPFFERANVVLLQRPLGIQFFLSSIRSAIRARRRQYQTRDLFLEFERAVQLSDMFVSILGHDLRTPLAAITLSADIILRRAPETRIAIPADRIFVSAQRMTRMIQQLLDYARVRQGQGIPLNQGPLDLGELARRVQQEITVAHPQARIHLSETGNLAGVWDGDRLEQLLTNLVGNAVQHGAKECPIILELDGDAPAQIHVRVKNQGTISPENLPTLFDAFRRAAAPGALPMSSTGLGLGLFIARETARAHGGDLHVHAGANEVTFEAVLPRESRTDESAAVTAH